MEQGWRLSQVFFALSLRLLEIHGYMSLDPLKVFGEKSTVYSGFTFVLGFTLVFRTSQAYTRFWTAATSMHEMGSEWYDSCASLIAFGLVSTKPYQEKRLFAHTVVRMFSLLHALAVEELSDVPEPNFPIIGISSFKVEDLSFILETMHDASQSKVHILLSWIKVFILRSLNDGTLAAPPPIVTRIYQELGSGLIEFHKAQQVVLWPFPFPYTQLNVFMIALYMVLTPLVIASWGADWIVTGIITFTSVMCMVSLDRIALELENPFGDDANDLPLYEVQDEFNAMLLKFLHPDAFTVPALSMDNMQQIEIEAFTNFISWETFSRGEANVMALHVSSAKGPNISQAMHAANGPNGRCSHVANWASIAIERYESCAHRDMKDPSAPQHTMSKNLTTTSASQVVASQLGRTDDNPPLSQPGTAPCASNCQPNGSSLASNGSYARMELVPEVIREEVALEQGVGTTEAANLFMPAREHMERRPSSRTPPRSISRTPPRSLSPRAVTAPMDFDGNMASALRQLPTSHGDDGYVSRLHLTPDTTPARGV